MLTLILAASISQVYREDFHFMKAQEDWVINNSPKPVRYTKFMPRELAEQVNLWADDCYRCRKRANEAVVAMGPKVIRHLFWALRAKDPAIAMHAEAVLLCLTKCPHCHGEGVCGTFVPMEPKTWACNVCWASEVYHEGGWEQACVHCKGDGYLEYQIREFGK